jgi:hypothetical protein
MKKGQSVLIKESNSGEIIKECRLLLDWWLNVHKAIS